MVALSVEGPIPAQRMRRRQLIGKFAAWFVALLLCVDVIGRVTVERNLRGDGCIALFIEVFLPSSALILIFGSPLRS